jgi:hypothetical protein
MSAIICGRCENRVDSQGCCCALGPTVLDPEIVNSYPTRELQLARVLELRQQEQQQRDDPAGYHFTGGDADELSALEDALDR